MKKIIEKTTTTTKQRNKDQRFWTIDNNKKKIAIIMTKNLVCVCEPLVLQEHTSNHKDLIQKKNEWMNEFN